LRAPPQPQGAAAPSNQRRASCHLSDSGRTTRPAKVKVVLNALKSLELITFVQRIAAMPFVLAREFGETLLASFLK